MMRLLYAMQIVGDLIFAPAGAEPEAKRQRVAVDEAKQEPKPDEAAPPKTETPTRRTSPRMR